jgi:hypothetical protein
LAIIEFDQPDLPWRYTPAAPAGDRLAPWLCLIVATSDEFSSLEQATADRPLGMVTITAAAALPDLSQSFAWAHAEAIAGADQLRARLHQRAVPSGCGTRRFQ